MAINIHKELLIISWSCLEFCIDQLAKHLNVFELAVAGIAYISLIGRSDWNNET